MFVQETLGRSGYAWKDISQSEVLDAYITQKWFLNLDAGRTDAMIPDIHIAFKTGESV